MFKPEALIETLGREAGRKFTESDINEIKARLMIEGLERRQAVAQIKETTRQYMKETN